ncbi:MAG: electron transfer flavoprotein subunit alpha/FixB family protein [Zoogloeaceae bacterium]|jgi:electron transfer flavoprotein alpha subunit|nr:electron transfer flavoprotein subunit alpha/FixB family protein [Zoogloeaceae bacterium]
MSGILIVAEHTRGVLAEASLELIGAAQVAREKLGGPVKALVVGESAGDFAGALNRPGVEEILVAQSDNPHFDAAAMEEVILTAARVQQPALILIAHSASGGSFAAAVAVRLGSGFAADVTGIGFAENGLAVTRAGFGNKVNVELDFPGKAVVVLTVRGATFKAPEGAGNATITPLSVPLEGLAGRYRHVGFEEAPASDIDIGKAEFILSIGRGIQDEKNVPRFAELAKKLGATLGCSRPVADSGWLPKPHQVGLTGKVAGNCKFYLALGISGAVQHLHGMKHVETIIAVNTDANAPIFNVAAYGVPMDVFAFADALERCAGTP